MANNSSFSSSIAFIILFLLNAALLYYLSLAHGRTCAEIGYPISTTFDRESPLQDLGATGDKAWIELTPARGGFLWVQTNIENSKEGHAKEEEWGISMFHGLHCLQMLRGAFRQVVGINETGEARQDLRAVGPRSGASRAHAHAALDIVHIGHCLGYLADVILSRARSLTESMLIYVYSTLHAMPTLRLSPL